MNDATITLYVDYRSPYSYLAKDDAYRLEDDFRVRIDWYPYGIDVEGVSVLSSSGPSANGARLICTWMSGGWRIRASSS
jgi:2-hydroxychromene-2-carboxylate isomerase